MNYFTKIRHLQIGPTQCWSVLVLQILTNTKENTTDSKLNQHGCLIIRNKAIFEIKKSLQYNIATPTTVDRLYCSFIKIEIFFNADKIRYYKTQRSQEGRSKKINTLLFVDKLGSHEYFMSALSYSSIIFSSKSHYILKKTIHLG